MVRSYHSTVWRATIYYFVASEKESGTVAISGEHKVQSTLGATAAGTSQLETWEIKTISGEFSKIAAERSCQIDAAETENIHLCGFSKRPQRHSRKLPYDGEEAPAYTYFVNISCSDCHTCLCGNDLLSRYGGGACMEDEPERQFVPPRATKIVRKQMPATHTQQHKKDGRGGLCAADDGRALWSPSYVMLCYLHDRDESGEYGASQHVVVGRCVPQSRQVLN